MTKDASRSIGAIAGLCLGIALMMAIGFHDMVSSALFGAGGAVAGGVTGEKIFAWLDRRKS